MRMLHDFGVKLLLLLEQDCVRGRLFHHADRGTIIQRHEAIIFCRY